MYIYTYYYIIMYIIYNILYIIHYIMHVYNTLYYTYIYIVPPKIHLSCHLHGIYSVLCSFLGVDFEALL